MQFCQRLPGSYTKTLSDHCAPLTRGLVLAYEDNMRRAQRPASSSAPREHPRGLQPLFASRLCALRGERGWTARETAARAGISEGYYCKLERGEQAPAFDKLPGLSRAFGIDEIDLFCFPGLTERHDIVDALRSAPEAVRLRVRTFLRDELAKTLRGESAEPAQPRRRSVGR